MAWLLGILALIVLLLLGYAGRGGLAPFFTNLSKKFKRGSGPGKFFGGLASWAAKGKKKSLWKTITAPFTGLAASAAGMFARRNHESHGKGFTSTIKDFEKQAMKGAVRIEKRAVSKAKKKWK